MARKYEVGDMALRCWADWYMRDGTPDRGSGVPVPKAPGTHSDPTLAAAVVESPEDRYAAAVDRALRVYGSQYHRAAVMRYCGQQSSIIIGHSVHGDVVKFRWDGQTAFHVCDQRLRLRKGGTRKLIKQIMQWVERDVAIFRRTQAGLIGNDGNIRLS